MYIRGCLFEGISCPACKRLTFFLEMNSEIEAKLKAVLPTLDDPDMKCWLGSLLDRYEAGTLNSVALEYLARWKPESKNRDQLFLIFRSAGAPPVVKQLEQPPLLALQPRLEPKKDESRELTLQISGGLVVVFFALAVCLLLPPYTPDTQVYTAPSTLLTRLRLVEHTALRSSLGSAVCLHMVRHRHGFPETSRGRTLVTRLALLNLSPAVSKAWAYLPKRRAEGCDCLTRTEFASFKLTAETEFAGFKLTADTGFARIQNTSDAAFVGYKDASEAAFASYRQATDAQLLELRAMVEHLTRQGAELANTSAQQKIRLDMLEDYYYQLVGVSGMVWFVSVAGMVALVFSGVASAGFAAPLLASGSASMGLGMLELALEPYQNL